MTTSPASCSSGGCEEPSISKRESQLIHMETTPIDLTTNSVFRRAYVSSRFSSAYRLKNPVLPTRKRLIETLGIDWFHSIVWVELTGNPLSDQDIAKVTSLKSIRGLVVSGYEIPTNDDDGVKYISPEISALSLEQIGKLRQLQRLRIDVGEAEAAGLTDWHKLSKLEEVIVSSADDSHLVHLARIPNLKSVELWGKVTDHVALDFGEEALLDFSESPSLQVLDVIPNMSSKTRDQLLKANPNLKTEPTPRLPIGFPSL